MADHQHSRGAPSLDLLIESLPDAAFTATPAGQLTRWNGAAAQLFGWSAKAVLGRAVPLRAPDGGVQVERLVQQVSATQTALREDLTLEAEDGTRREVRLSLTPLALPDEALVVGILQDLRPLVHAQQNSKEQLHHLQVILDAIPAPIFYKDAQGLYAGCNQAFAAYLGRPREKIVGMSVYDVAPKDLADVYFQADRKLFLERSHQTYEASVQYADGTRHDVVFHKAVFFDSHGEASGIVGTMLDISDRKRAEAALKHQAFHDPLTGLPNRSLLVDRLEQALSMARRQGGRLAVLFIDLDRFKWVNDTLGHEAGDTLLVETASRLRDCLRDSDTVARLGGDEFVIVLPQVHGSSGAVLVAERVLEACRTPVTVGENTVRIIPSIGIAMFPEDGQDTETLLHRADSAMYVAKDRKSGCHLFVPDEEPSSQRLRLEAELYEAIERLALTLWYQPIVSMKDRSVLGFEGLVRWKHSARGLLRPGEFIPLAEETGLIIPLGRWVMRAACAQLEHWNSAGHDHLHVSVNVSALQFRHPHFVEDVRRALSECRIQPHQLVLEITESSMMPGSLDATSVVRALKELGVGLAIDDFGTGYSSMASLRTLPLDYLKIDRSFVAELNHAGRGVPIVQSILALAQNLNMTALAEGVETEEQFEVLRRLGCPQVQGYLVSPPVEVEIASAYLTHRP